MVDEWLGGTSRAAFEGSAFASSPFGGEGAFFFTDELAIGDDLGELVVAEDLRGEGAAAGNGFLASSNKGATALGFGAAAGDDLGELVVADEGSPRGDDLSELVVASNSGDGSFAHEGTEDLIFANEGS